MAFRFGKVLSLVLVRKMHGLNMVAGQNSLRKFSRENPKFKWIAGLFCLCWAIVFFTIWVGSPTSATTRQMIETLNGATWPEKWHEFQNDHGGLFACLVATRTALNLSAPVALIGGAGWFLTIGWRKLMNMSLLEVVRMHEARLVNAIVTEINSLRPDHKLTDAEVQQIEAKAARVFEELPPAFPVEKAAVLRPRHR